MELTITYISSQIVSMIAYMFAGTTYHAKNRKTILVLNFCAQIGFAITYILLRAWSGVAVSLLGTIRNIIFMVDESKNGKRKRMGKTDIWILAIMYTMSIILAILTYEEIYSLLPVLATMIYTYAVCQKNIKIYKILGIPIQILWVLYALSLMSVVAIIIESIMLINCCVGYFREAKRKNT